MKSLRDEIEALANSLFDHAEYFGSDIKERVAAAIARHPEPVKDEPEDTLQKLLEVMGP